MTIGLQLLRSIVDSGAQTTFRQCPQLWFSQAEMNHYEFIRGHLSRFGRLPSHEAMNENGLPLVRAVEPPAYYMNRVRRRAIFAQLQPLHQEFLASIAAQNPDDAVGMLRRMLAATNSVNPASDVTTIQEEAHNVVNRYLEASRTFRLIGVDLGWECVNTVTDGGHAGDVIVLVGRPNVGKTYGLLWMLRRAWLSGASILIATMEMSAEQITRRLVGMHSGINPEFIRRGRLSTWSHNLMMNTVADLDDMPPIHIITGNFQKRTSDIDKAIQELQPDIVFIDGGYLLTPDKARGGKGSRREVIADVIEELKGLAINRARPLVTSVQFNREVKKKQRGDMDLSQIGETDVIAQIATIVLGMRWGDNPYERTRRRFEMLKNRDGDLIKFETNFSFAPVDLSFTRMLNDNDEGEDSQEAVDVSNMV